MPLAHGATVGNVPPRAAAALLLDGRAPDLVPALFGVATCPLECKPLADGKYDADRARCGGARPALAAAMLDGAPSRSDARL